MAVLKIQVQKGIRKGSFFFHAENGHSYHVNREMRGGRISLRCMFYKKNNCKARASICRNGCHFQEGYLHRHNHVSERNLIYERRFRTSVLNECRREESAEKSLKKIYHEVRRNMRIPANALVNVPFVKIRISMQNARQSIFPNIPHTLSELAAILENNAYTYFNSTLDRADTIYLGKFGQSCHGTKCVIFASRRLLKYLAKVKHVMSDATFASVPAALDCYQMWTIIVLRRHHVIPLVRVLMQTKSERAYNTALMAIKAAVPRFRPESVMCDFEAAQANAWETQFPTIVISGCFFHSSKAICLYARSLGLLPLIQNDEEIDSIVRSTCALALLPVNMMVEGLTSVAIRCNQNGHWDTMEPFLLYIVRTWFTPSRLRMFSVYECPDRTTNACESSHSSFMTVVRQKHPSIWSFLHGVSDCEDITKFDIDILNAGFNPSRKRRASVLANDASIKGLTEDLTQGFIDVGTFLRRASRRVQGLYDMVLNL